MPAVAFAMPIMPGKTEYVKSFQDRFVNSQPQEFATSRQNAGLTTEKAWVQQTPGGDFSVVYHEAADPGGVMQTWANSNAPFDADFRNYVQEAHGVTIAEALQMEAPELIWDWNGDQATAGGDQHAFVAPILPGKLEAFHQMIEQMGGRRDEIAASRQRAGITTERVWLLNTPHGASVVVVRNSADPGQVNQVLAESADPYDVWFRQQVETLHGFKFEEAAKAPSPELICDWCA